MVFLTMAQGGLVIWQKDVHSIMRNEKFESTPSVLDGVRASVVFVGVTQTERQSKLATY
jgi:hypothetical protein